MYVCMYVMMMMYVEDIHVLNMYVCIDIHEHSTISVAIKGLVIGVGSTIV